MECKCCGQLSCLKCLESWTDDEVEDKKWHCPAECKVGGKGGKDPVIHMKIEPVKLMDL